jgi:hypothetical protein
MQVLKTKTFAKFAHREEISDGRLSEAIRRAEKELIDAELGGGLIKQRVARAGEGRSGGYRTIIAYWTGKRAVFLFGFAKSDRESLSLKELNSLRQLGQSWLSASAAAVEKALEDHALVEVEDEPHK